MGKWICSHEGMEVLGVLGRAGASFFCADHGKWKCYPCAIGFSCQWKWQKEKQRYIIGSGPLDFPHLCEMYAGEHWVCTADDSPGVVPGIKSPWMYLALIHRESWSSAFDKTNLEDWIFPSALGYCTLGTAGWHVKRWLLSLCKLSWGITEVVTVLQMCGKLGLWRDSLGENGIVWVSHLLSETWQMCGSHLSWVIHQVSDRARNRIQVFWLLEPPSYLQNHIASQKLLQK